MSLVSVMNKSDFHATIKSLSRCDWRRLYLAWAFEVVCIVLTLFLAANSSVYMAPIYILILGMFQHRNALLAHDAAHLRYTKVPILDRVTAECLGLPIAVAIYDGYCPYHFDHHTSLGTDEDPEHHYRSDWGDLSRNNLAWTFCTDLIGMGIRSQVRFLYDVIPRTLHSKVVLVGFWAAVAWIAFYFHQQYLLLLWVIALLTSFWAFFRFRAFLEHIDVPDDGKHSSHRFHTSPVLRYLVFPYNTWCHYEHHLFPSVPFHNLPRLRKLLREPEFKKVVDIREVFPLAHP